MRALRRITGAMRYDKHCANTDLQVRAAAGQPSIDCLLMRARLRYLRRMCKHSNQALYIITCMRHKDKPIPWVTQIVRDLATLRKHCGASGSKLPEHNAPLEVWSKLFDSKAAWDQAVQSIYFVESVSDTRSNSCSSNLSNNIHVCSQCPALPDGTRPCWSTAKALESHMRSKHKCLSQYRCYVREDGRCPICGTVYNTRIRCLAHITDRR